MNKIDEIALMVWSKVSKSTSVGKSIAITFTHALLAELSKDAEPVAFAVLEGRNTEDSGWGYIAGWPEACHEHINDAINEHNIEGAGKWRVVSLYEHPAPVIASGQKAEGKDNAELVIHSNNAGAEQQRKLDGKVEMGQLLDDSQNQTSGDSKVKRNLLLIGDTFRGDDLKLAASIESLISLNDCGALVPHGIGGHARSLLACAALRLLASPPNTADIEERVAEACAKYCHTRAMHAREAIRTANAKTSEHIQLRREARSGEASDCATGLIEGKWREYL